jgi:hypothetical protein
MPSRIQPIETEAMGDSPYSEAPTAPSVSEISFWLAKGRGQARFAAPTAATLAEVERRTGRLDAIASPAEKADFFRELARACCLSWADAPKMPDPENIRVQDDESLLILFATELNPPIPEPSAYCELLEGGSSRSPEFDAFEITLELGAVARFDEPTQKDSKQRQKAQTSTDGTLQFAAALCTHWNGQPVTWSEVLTKLRSISLADLYRISVGLGSFRG